MSSRYFKILLKRQSGKKCGTSGKGVVCSWNEEVKG